MAEPSASVYPASLDSSTTLGGDVLNFKQFTLDAGINSLVTTISVSESIASVNFPCYGLVGSEIVYIESSGSGDFTSVVRGANGTTAASHISGDILYLVYAANSFNQLKRAIIATQTELGTDPAGSLATVAARLAIFDSFPEGTMLNGKLSVTVSASDLIVAIKTSSGSDPSSSDPVYVWINGTKRTITAATSMTLADATNWYNAGSSELATKEIDYFAYAVWDSNSSIVAVSAARIPYGKLVSDFSSTSTNEKYLGNYANFTSTDDVVVIGRFAATLSAGAGYTWTVPTYTTKNLIQRPIYETRWLDWLPIVSQGASSNISKTVNKASYLLSGSLMQYAFRLTFSAAGTAGSAIIFTLPFTPAYLNYFFNGYGLYRDNGTASYDILIFDNNSTNQCIFNATSVTVEAAAMGTNPNMAVASNDAFLGQGFFEV